MSSEEWGGGNGALSGIGSLQELGETASAELEDKALLKEGFLPLTCFWKDLLRQMSRHLLSWDLAIGSPTPTLRARDWALLLPAACCLLGAKFAFGGKQELDLCLLRCRAGCCGAGRAAAVQGGLLRVVREAGGFLFITFLSSFYLQKLPLKTKIKIREIE